MQLIGISGEIGVGKDTAADMLVKHYGFHKVTIGRYIREELALGHDMLKSGKIMPDATRRLLQSMGRDKLRKALFAKPTTPDVRESLQWFGEMWVAIDPHHWISKLLCEVRDGGHEKIVWCDVRRPLEFHTVKDMGGIMWRINRQIVKRRVADIKAAQHITETALVGHVMAGKFDAYIPNNGSLSQLQTRIFRLMQTL